MGYAKVEVPNSCTAIVMHCSQFHGMDSRPTEINEEVPGILPSHNETLEEFFSSLKLVQKVARFYNGLTPPEGSE